MNNQNKKIRAPKRNRKAAIRPDQVYTNARGDIVKMPVTAMLDCFCNPVDYHRGVYDKKFRRPRRDGSEIETPWGCAGCKSQATCSTIVLERIEGSPEVSKALRTWQDATAGLPQAEQYMHPTFQVFASSCENRAWTTSNDDALSAKRAADAKRNRKARQTERRRARRGKPITIEFVDALDAELASRMLLIRSAAQQSGAPPWLRTLDERSISFTCEVWRTTELLRRRYKHEITGGEIARKITALNKHDGRPMRSLHTRVNDAQKRIQRLESEVEGLPVWPDFKYDDGNQPRSDGCKMNGASGRNRSEIITHILDS